MDPSLQMFEEPHAQLPLWSDRDSVDGWAFRESPRARRLTVRVFHSGRVEVVVPARTSRLAVERFVERHRLWIEKKRAEAKKNAVPPEPFPPSQIELASAGENWLLHYAGGNGRLRLKAVGPGLLSLSGNSSDLRTTQNVLRRWLCQRAAE